MYVIRQIEMVDQYMSVVLTQNEWAGVHKKKKRKKKKNACGFITKKDASIVTLVFVFFFCFPFLMPIVYELVLYMYLIIYPYVFESDMGFNETWPTIIWVYFVRITRIACLAIATFNECKSPPFACFWFSNIYY